MKCGRGRLIDGNGPRERNKAVAGTRRDGEVHAGIRLDVQSRRSGSILVRRRQRKATSDGHSRCEIVERDSRSIPLTTTRFVPNGTWLQNRRTPSPSESRASAPAIQSHILTVQGASALLNCSVPELTKTPPVKASETVPWAPPKTTVPAPDFVMASDATADRSGNGDDIGGGVRAEDQFSARASHSNTAPPLITVAPPPASLRGRQFRWHR